MLPDLVQMLGRRRIQASNPSVDAGVRFHHATDAVFHDHTLFSSLQNEARRDLRHLGVSRGPRLAVAHVGLELMLDAELAAGKADVQHYSRALSCLPTLQGALTMDGDAGNFGELLRLRERLVERLPTLIPRTPEQLVERLVRILGHRPALSLDAAEIPAVLSWAGPTWQTVRARRDEWLDQLKAGLRLGVGTARLSGDSAAVSPFESSP